MDFKYSDAEIARIKNIIANKEAIIDELESDNENGQYNQEIEAIKNEINGFKYTISYEDD